MERCPDLPVMNNIYSKIPKIISQTGKKSKDLNNKYWKGFWEIDLLNMI